MVWWYDFNGGENMGGFNKEKLRQILIDQREIFLQKERGTPREALEKVKVAARSPYAVVISGLRRVGKSTLLAQLSDQLGDSEFYYVNFEDERLADFKAGDAAALYETLFLLYGKREIFLLDEVQNVAGWERFVRRFMDQGNKFFITGSNASLLSKELGTKLTGRYIPIELFPFSFTEYLKFNNYALPDINHLNTDEAMKLAEVFNDYLEKGGIAEALKYPQLPVHMTLYNDVLYRDIAARYKIEEVKALKELAFYLMGNVGNLLSYNKLKELLKLGSVNTVKNFIEHMECSWLISVVNIYAYSIKKQQIAPKRIYCSDTGMVNSVAFNFSKNAGRYLENAVFLGLRRIFPEIFYYKTQDGGEVDFYVPAKKMLIQVAHDISEEAVLQRETKALRVAMEELGFISSWLFTGGRSEHRQLDVGDGKSITVLPVYEWLLGELPARAG
jgi:predicted AAA+ superfamily ATPase